MWTNSLRLSSCSTLHIIFVNTLVFRAVFFPQNLRILEMDRRLELRPHRAITCPHYNFMRTGEQFLPSVVNTARADGLASKGELIVGCQQPLGQEQLYQAQQAGHSLFWSHLVFKHDFISPCQIMYMHIQYT